MEIDSLILSDIDRETLEGIFKLAVDIDSYEMPIDARFLIVHKNKFEKLESQLKLILEKLKYTEHQGRRVVTKPIVKSGPKPRKPLSSSRLAIAKTINRRPELKEALFYCINNGLTHAQTVEYLIEKEIKTHKNEFFKAASIGTYYSVARTMLEQGL